MFRKSILFCILFCAVSFAHSHGGRTNSQGCHNQKSTGSYHCHNGGTSNPKSTIRVGYYSNCSQARSAGAAPMRRGDSGYRRGLDRDNDGVACE